MGALVRLVVFGVVVLAETATWVRAEVVICVVNLTTLALAQYDVAVGLLSKGKSKAEGLK